MKNKDVLVIRDEKIEKMRCHQVIKHNKIVQKSRYTLSAKEEKTLEFLISLILPPTNEASEQSLEYTFEIQDYCKVCGLDENNGNNYIYTKQTLKSLRDKSFWLPMEDGSEALVSWLSRVKTNKKGGKAVIEFDKELVPYLLNQEGNTTRYQLINVLPLKSKYSIRFYTLACSFKNLKSEKTYELEELKNLLMIPNNEYKELKDFKKRVLKKAKEEINFYTDINIDFLTKTTKGISKITIIAEIKDSFDMYEARDNANIELNY
jgi:plasmid replication initiation protein